MEHEALGTGQKALRINLDAHKYGTFAEIGAGQEVVRWFFRVGGASHTIAKSMSAYDMTISDAIYGECTRYVSRERLADMLRHEYDLLLERLGTVRGGTTDFFAFADTVTTRNHEGSNECHGWMGVKFQTSPGAQPSEIIIHVRMLDKDRLAQQEALGIVGINLCYGCFFQHDEPESLLESLLDSLSTERIEVDMIHFDGPDYQEVDHRKMAVHLVKLGLTEAAMFNARGEVLQPSEVIYKRPVVVERGSFRPLTLVNMDLLDCANAQFGADWGEEAADPVVLFEITLRQLSSDGTENGEIDWPDFLARCDIIASTGATVMISDYIEYYRVAQFLQRYTKKKVGLAMGIPSLRDLFDEKYYDHLEGGILESFGRLFKNDLRLYVYPLLDVQTHHLMTVPRLRVEPHLQHLYEFLMENGSIQSIDFYERDYLPIFSRDVLQLIQDANPYWEEMVPAQVAQIIKERGYFGYGAPRLTKGAAGPAQSPVKSPAPPAE